LTKEDVTGGLEDRRVTLFGENQVGAIAVVGHGSGVDELPTCGEGVDFGEIDGRDGFVDTRVRRTSP
jgi:hypothetical protein